MYTCLYGQHHLHTHTGVSKITLPRIVSPAQNFSGGQRIVITKGLCYLLPVAHSHLQKGLTHRITQFGFHLKFSREDRLSMIVEALMPSPPLHQLPDIRQNRHGSTMSYVSGTHTTHTLYFKNSCIWDIAQYSSPRLTQHPTYLM